MTKETTLRYKIQEIIEHPLLEYHNTEGHFRPNLCVEGDIDSIIAIFKQQFLEILSTPLSSPNAPLNEEGTKQRIRELIKEL